MIFAVVRVINFPHVFWLLAFWQFNQFNCNNCSKMFGTSSSGNEYTFCSRPLKVKRCTSFFCHPSSCFSFTFAHLLRTLTSAMLTAIGSLRLTFAFLSFFLTSFLLSSSMGGFVLPWLAMLNSMSCARVANSSNIRDFIP